MPSLGPSLGLLSPAATEDGLQQDYQAGELAEDLAAWLPRDSGHFPDPVACDVLTEQGVQCSSHLGVSGHFPDHIFFFFCSTRNGTQESSTTELHPSPF